jgi:hypothetical protein
MNVRAWGLLLFLLAFVLCGCGADDSSSEPEGDEFEAVLFDSTHLLGDEALAALRAVEPDGTLRFEGTPPQLAGLEQLDVLISPGSPAEPAGFLRLVVAIESDAEGLVLRTLHAPIQLAFRKLHVRAKRSVDDLMDAALLGEPTRQPLGERLDSISGARYTEHEFELQVFDGDGLKDSVGDQAYATVQFGGGVSYVFGIDVDWGEAKAVPVALAKCILEAIKGAGCDVKKLLPPTTVGYEFEASVKASLAAEGVAYKGFNAPYQLPPIPLPEVQIAFLRFYPQLLLSATFEGAATSQFSLAMTAFAHAGAGVSYSNKSDQAEPKLPYADYDFEAPNVDATLSANGRIGLGANLRVLLYKTAGPYAGLELFTELDAQQNRDPCYELTAGAALTYGFDVVVDLPLFDPYMLAHWGSSANLFEELIESGACKPLPGGAATGTGGAADPSSFASPTFTPWSKSYSGLVHAYPYALTPDVVSMHVEPTIDGRFVVAGTASKALLKIDELGNPVWAKSYRAATHFGLSFLFDTVLPTATASAKNGTLFGIAHPWVVLELEQDGRLIRARRFDVPHHTRTLMLVGIAPADDGGFFVAGNRADDVGNWLKDVDAFIARFDVNGELVWAKRVGDAGQSELVRTVFAYEGGVVIGGTTHVGVSEVDYRAWVARFDGAGNKIWSKRLRSKVCTSIFEAHSHVTTGLAARDGDLILGGFIEAANNDSLFFKLKPDGTLAWHTTETDLEILQSGFEVTSLVELPTSGYLAAGQRYDYNSSTMYPGVFVGALDGIGRFQWLQFYDAGASLGIKNVDSMPFLQLTRDGGALVTAYSEPLAPDQKGLWIFKLPAKDGLIELSPGSDVIRQAKGWKTADDCLELEELSAAVKDDDVALVPLELSAESVTSNVAQQTP